MAIELNEGTVQRALVGRFGSSPGGAGGVIWVEDGDEVAVWLDSLEVSVRPGLLHVRVDLESRQTGRARQDVAIALADPAAPRSLLAVTTHTTPGESRLAARWGRTLQDAVWAAVLDLAGEDAVGVAAAPGRLVVHSREDR